jgi:hypothetical protein
MGYSASKKDLLESKDFHVLFSNKKHHAKWVDAAKAAQAYAKAEITHGEEPRPDDIAGALLPILNADPDLLKHQRENHATAEKYREAFADLIVDQVLIEPNRNKEKADGARATQQESGKK